MYFRPTDILNPIACVSDVPEVEKSFRIRYSKDSGKRILSLEYNRQAIITTPASNVNVPVFTSDKIKHFYLILKTTTQFFKLHFRNEQETHFPTKL